MSGVGGRVRATLRVAAEVVRNPELRRLQLAFLAFNSVEYGAWVAILLYAYEATGPASVGLVAIAQLLPAAVVAPLAANLGDRFARERVLALGYALIGTLLGLTAAGMVLGWPPVVVYLGAIGASVALTIARPTHNALLPTLARTAEELTAANATTSIAEAGGILLGPLAAAVILTVSGPGAVLVVLAALALVAALLVGGVRPEPGPREAVPAAGADTAGITAEITDGSAAEAGAEGRLSDVLAGFRALARHGDARLLVGVLAARTLMIGITDVLFVLVAIELFETGESGAALLSAAMGAGGVVGGAAAFMLVGRPRVTPILAGCALVWGAAFAVMGVTASGTIAPFLLVVGGTGLAVMDVAGRTILQRAVKDDVLTRVFGILEGLIMAALAAGALLVPIVVGVVGLQSAILVFAAVLPVTIGLAVPGLRAIDRRAVVPARAINLLRRLLLFEALDPPVMEALARASRWETAGPGEVVILEGEDGDSYYVLESGAMRVTQGDRHLRDFDAVGEGFGEIALLHGVPRTATVTAILDSSMLVLDRESFLGAVARHPTVSAEAHRIADAHQR
jgi:MFS family permease